MSRSKGLIKIVLLDEMVVDAGEEFFGGTLGMKIGSPTVCGGLLVVGGINSLFGRGYGCAASILAEVQGC